MRKIMVVDDSGFTRAALRKILLGAGYEVFEASSGMEALEMMAIVKPDLVTLDLLMPEMRGDELLNHLHSLCNQCPLLVITADIQMITRHNLIDAGAAGFITKPIRENELLSEIEQLLTADGK